jgi:hypothetical protein
VTPQARLETWLLWAGLCVSLLAGAAAQAMLAWLPGEFTQHWFRRGPVLLAVHLSTLGLLATLVLGVLTQFLPMLLGRALGSALLAGVCLGLFAASALGLWMGFAVGFSSAGAWAAGLGLLASAGGFLALAAPALLGGDASHRLSRWTLASSLACLVLEAALGTLLAQGLVRAPLLPQEPLRLLALHAHLGLFGFGALVVFAVSYELLPMFNLAKGYPTWPGWAALGLAWAGLGSLALWALLGWLPLGLWAGLLALSGLSYLVQLAWILSKALRPQHEAATQLFRLAGVALLAAVIGGLWLACGDAPAPGPLAAYVYLLLYGFLGSAIFSQIQKIVPLLAWVDRFAPWVGKASVPTAGQLLDARLAWALVPLHALALACGGVGLAMGSAALIRAAGILGLLCFLDCAGLVLVCRLKGRARPPASPPVPAR